MKRVLSILLIIVTLFGITGCQRGGSGFTATDSSSHSVDINKSMYVHYIDVGQGDATFIEFPNGETMLIDAGEKEYGKKVSNYIATSGYSRVDYVVATHPHTDHIGGMREVIESFDIGKIYMPNVVHDGATYEQLLLAIQEKGLKIKAAQAGDSFSVGAVSVNILSPVSESYDNLNNYSVVMKMVYGEISFLFMGDAEASVEKEIEADVSANVLKVGHHGSSTSSSIEFIKRVDPDVAIISVGEENSYGHPHEETIEAFEEYGTKIMRTDKVSTIMLSTNGEKVLSSIGILADAADDDKKHKVDHDNDGYADDETYDYKYVLNTNSKKIHYPSCESADDIIGKNRETTSKSIKQLKKEGYEPCRFCSPK